jgi:pimeloyl-ACP methyl ester carboxylesterase
MIAVLKGLMIRPSRNIIMEKGEVPGLWILGKLDKYISYETVLKRVTLPANARVVVLENSGHMGFIEEEDLSVKVVEDFIKNLK